MEFGVRVATMRGKEVGVPSGVSLKVSLSDMLLPRNWHRVSVSKAGYPKRGHRLIHSVSAE